VLGLVAGRESVDDIAETGERIVDLFGLFESLALSS
jgi:hypothetical protein